MGLSIHVTENVRPDPTQMKGLYTRVYDLGLDFSVVLYSIFVYFQTWMTFTL